MTLTSLVAVRTTSSHVIVSPWPFIIDETFELQASNGIYYLTAKGSCTSATAVTAEAWWLDTGQTISICPTSTSSVIKFVDGSDTIRCGDNASLGIGHASCGCGPRQILCFPQSIVTSTLTSAIRNEFASRVPVAG